MRVALPYVRASSLRYGAPGAPMIWSYPWFSSAISSTLLIGPAAATEAGGSADGGGGADAGGSAEGGATVDADGLVSTFGLSWPQPAVASVAASTSADMRR